jgi:hypothetical protein
MPAYNFKSRFAAKVQSGEKLHTIRARRKDGHRPRPGQPMHAYCGLRTKKTELLLLSTVSKVESIRIDTEGHIRIGDIGDSRVLAYEEVEALAKADGFDSPEEFVAFFKDTHGLPFIGDLIHWRFPL